MASDYSSLVGEYQQSANLRIENLIIPEDMQ